MLYDKMDIREILLKNGTGYTRNKNNNKTENTARKNTTNGNNQLKQSPKSILQINQPK